MFFQLCSIEVCHKLAQDDGYMTMIGPKDGPTPRLYFTDFAKAALRALERDTGVKRVARRKLARTASLDSERFDESFKIQSLW